MWNPFRRREPVEVRVVVTHQFAPMQFDAILSTIRPPESPSPEPAAARRKSEREVELDAWLASTPWGDPNKEGHAHALVRIYLGRQEPTEEWTWGAAAAWLKAAGAPLGV